MHKPNKPTNGVINIITRGIAASDNFNTSRRIYIQAMCNISFEHKQAKNGEEITFLDEDLRMIQSLYDDVVLISAMVVNFKV